MNSTDKLKETIGMKKAEGNALVQKSMGNALLDTISTKAFKEQLAVALPRMINADRFVRVVITECRKTPALLKTSKESFLGALMQSAQLGLDPSSALGQAYLIPYKDKCQLIVGYKGMIELARRSGQIKSISAYCVYEKDAFEYTLGLHPDIKHTPSFEADRGSVKFVYAVAQLVDGGTQFEVMSRAEIEAVRNASSGWIAYKKGFAKNCIWVEHFDEMARKTAVRRLFKMLPVSIEIQRAIYADEKAERGEYVSASEASDSIYADTGKEVNLEVEEAEEVKSEDAVEVNEIATEARFDNVPPADGNEYEGFI